MALAHPMDSSRQDALVKLESELRVNLSLVGMISRLERTGDGEGGFMTRDERMSVEAFPVEDSPRRVGKIIEILRTKSNASFDRFCTILYQSGNETWGEKLISCIRTERADLDSDTKKAANHSGKSGDHKIIQPQMPALMEHLQKMEHELYLHILSKSRKSYRALKLSCEDHIKSLRHHGHKSEQQILTDDRELMCQEIKRYTNLVDIRFLEMIINLCGNRDLSSYLEDYHILKQTHLSANILEWGRNSAVRHEDGPHLIVKTKGYPHTVPLKLIDDLQQFLPKLGLCHSFFSRLR
jgi:hypothetical protein